MLPKIPNASLYEKARKGALTHAQRTRDISVQVSFLLNIVIEWAPNYEINGTCLHVTI